jgi:hypothetical protein
MSIALIAIPNPSHHLSPLRDPDEIRIFRLQPRGPINTCDGITCTTEHLKLTDNPRYLFIYIIIIKAKVISYKDIEEARIKRAAKDVIKGKGKRGRKRKSIELEADKPEPGEPDEPDPLPQVARAVEKVMPVRGICGRKRKGAALEPDEPEPKPQVARLIEALGSWRAPLARMY